MSHIRGCLGLVLAASLLLVSFAARADIYAAVQAYEKKDFARAFELYRTLAELGQADAQEALAVMYVNAEGVKAKNLRWNTAPQQARLDGYKANRAWTGDLFAFC